MAIEINRADAEGLFEEAQSRVYEAGKHGKEGGRGNRKTPRNLGVTAKIKTTKIAEQQ